MARDDYDYYGLRGRQHGPEYFSGREWQQSGQSRYRGQPGYQGGYTQGGYGYGPGGYGQGWSGPGGYGQGGFGQGAFGQGSYGQPRWQPGEGQGMYGQHGPGQSGYGPGWSGQGGYYGQGWSGQAGYQGGYGQGRVAWPEQREAQRGGFSGQQGYEQGQQGYQQAQPGMQRGQFAGRGPKGYKRPDDRIREDVNEELTRNPDIDATGIEVSVRDGEITLTGVVDERRDKRLAEDLAERCSGVHEVHNQLRVSHGQPGSERESGEIKSRAGRSASSATS